MLSRLLYSLPLLTTLALSATAAGASSRAETLVRRGQAMEALQALRQGEADMLPPAEAEFWRGRALLQLGRTEEACAAFLRVPESHPLFPYAARGILYCAWQSPRLDFAETVRPLLSVTHSDIAKLAQAALVEQQLRYSDSVDTSAYSDLQLIAEDHPDLQPIVKLLELNMLRKNGDYNASEELARVLEQDPDLSSTMRQRVRLALAELYYAREKDAPSPDAEEQTPADDGMGEETLLQFITANPDSPLLIEAFRRLYSHGALSNSEFAQNKLTEWSEDSLHPRRAALAIFSLQMHRQALGHDASTLVNRASVELPGEPISAVIVQEHIRLLFEQGKHDEAERYLSLLESMQRSAPLNAHTTFLRALSIFRRSPLRARDLFLRCARQADDSLLIPALTNALICSVQGRDIPEAEKILAEPQTDAVRRALLLTHAKLILEQQPIRARAELQEVLTMSPSHEQSVDVQLSLAQLDLVTDAQETFLRLLSITPEERRRWTDEQELHFAAMLERAADTLSQEQADTPSAESLLQRLYTESSSLQRKEALALHLADRYARNDQHKLALHILLDLAQHQPTGDHKAHTLLYAGLESTRLGTLDSLKHALQLYAESARQSAALIPIATIEQAAIYVRINQSSEAFSLINSLHLSGTPLTPAEQAHLLTVQADAYSADRTPQSNQAAIDTCEKIQSIADLPQAWRLRALLQHAVLCARSNRHEQALSDYQSVLRLTSATADPLDEHSSFLYYYAGSGAVYQLLELKRYQDAADLADRIAAWPGTPENPSATIGVKSDSFKRWARSIRQTHYLPGNIVEAPLQ